MLWRKKRDRQGNVSVRREKIVRDKETPTRTRVGVVCCGMQLFIPAMRGNFETSSSTSGALSDNPRVAGKKLKLFVLKGLNPLYQNNAFIFFEQGQVRCNLCQRFV